MKRGVNSGYAKFSVPLNLAELNLVEEFRTFLGRRDARLYLKWDSAVIRTRARLNRRKDLGSNLT